MLKVHVTIHAAKSGLFSITFDHPLVSRVLPWRGGYRSYYEARIAATRFAGCMGRVAVFD
jgi:hypothetical protein